MGPGGLMPAGPLSLRLASRGLHPGAGADERGGSMAKRVNYGFEKRQRELRKQKKSAEKAERKLQDAANAAKEAGEEAPAGASSDRTDRD